MMSVAHAIGYIKDVLDYIKLPIQMAHGAGRRAAAARTGWAVRDCADLAHPFAPLERSAEHLAVAAATAYNMMECIIELDSIINNFTWACLLPRRYGRGGRLARARRSPGHLPGALAALRGPHGHQHHHCLSWTT